MAENFQDNVSYGNSTLAVSGDAVAVGSTNAGAKSVIFNNTGAQGHLAWQPTVNRTINLPDLGGTIQLTGQVPGAIIAGTQTGTSGSIFFSNSNGVTFGMSNSSIITASYTVPSTAGLISGVNISAGTTSNNLSALTFSNSNGLSFGLNGSVITGSYTVPTQTQYSFSNLNGVTFGTVGSTVTASVAAQTAAIFSNSNGISFGTNAGTVTASYTVPTQTNQTEGLYAIGNTIGQSSSSTFDARTMSFSGAGNISLGYSGNALIISGAGGGGGSVNISAGTTSNNLTNFVFSNSNGVSFGLNGSTITASAAGGGGTLGFYATGNTTQNSSTTLTANSINYNAIGGVTIGYSNGSIQLSAPATSSISATGAVSISVNGNTVSIGAPLQTNQTIGIYATSNTIGASSFSTYDARSLTFQGAGVASIGHSNGSIIISVPSGGAGNINVSAGTTSNNLTNFVFSNSNGVSFGLTGSTVTASIPVQTSLSYSNLNGLSFGIAGSTLTASMAAQTAYSFSNANNISFGVAGSTITASASFAQSVQTQSNIQGISAGTTSQNSGNIVFANSNGISFGLSAGSITATVNPGAAAGIAAIQAGTQTQTSGTLVFANSNGVTFGLSGSSQITASVAAGGGTLGFYATGNTTNNSSTTLTANSINYNAIGGISVGYSNGSIQVSAPSISSLSATGAVSISINGNTISVGAPVQTNQSLGFYAVSNTTQNSSSTFDARSLSFQGAGNVSIGYSNGSIVISGSGVGGGGGGVVLAAGTQTGNTSGSVIFSNLNGISFGMNNSSIITASYAGLNFSAGTTSNNLTNFVFSNSNGVSFGLSGSTITGSQSTLVYSNSNNVTFGINASTLTASVAAQSVQSEGLYAIGNTTGQSSSSTFDARTLSISGVGNISVGYSGNALVISGGGGGGGVAISAAGNSTSTGTVVFSNANGISFGMSNNGVVTASVAAIAASNVVFSNSNNIFFGANVSTVTASIGPVYTYEPYVVQNSASAVVHNANSSGPAFFFPFVVNVPVAAQWMNLAQTVSIASTAGSGQQSLSMYYGLFTRGIGTNSSILSMITSASFGISVTFTSVTGSINFPGTTNSTGFITASTSSTAIAGISSVFGSARLVQVPINSTLSPGVYWLGLLHRQSTNSQSCGFNIGYVGAAIVAPLASIAPYGSNTSAFTTGTGAAISIGGNWNFGIGSYVSAGQTNLPNSLALSALTNNLSVLPVIKFYSSL